MIFQKEIGPRKSTCSYRKLHEKPDILRPCLILSFFYVPDMMAHVPPYGVRLYVRERGKMIWPISAQIFLSLPAIRNF